MSDLGKEITTPEETKDIVDSIRTEASSFSPERADKARIVIDKMSKFIEDTWGNFMPQESKERAKTSMGNIVFVDDPSQIMEVFESEGRVVDQAHKDNPYAFHVTPEEIIIVKDPNKIGEDLPSDIKETVVRKFGGSMEEALHRYGSFVTTNACAHELVHSYLDPKLPLALKELVAYNLQDILSRNIYGTSPVKPQITDRYKHFLEKYGDDFIRFIFGGKIGAIANFRISRETDNLEMIQKPSTI